MFIQRYYLDCLSHASYLVADERTKEAAVIDPQRDVDGYVRDAEQRGWTIKHVILTHFHADFVAGHIELRDRVGARIYMGAKAEAEFDFTPLEDGDAIEFGDVRLVGMETPGHTPEGLTVVAYDQHDGQLTPYAAFTGDTLFIGDVGRPDLLASIGVTAVELANMLYESLHHKLLQLPDSTLVYPAHGAGSMCGKSLGNEAVSTIGQQRQYNYALQPMSREAFVELVSADQPEAPGYFVHDAILNRQERASLDESMKDTMQALTIRQVLALLDQGAQVIDSRSAVEFAGAHLRGAIHFGIDGKFATWAGTVLKKDSPIIVVADDDRIAESIMRLGRIGFDHVAGYLDAGMAALNQRSELIRSVLRVAPTAVAEVASPWILDVRTAKEFAAGHLENSYNIPLSQLQSRLREIPRDRQILVHCEGGYRSSMAVSILQRDGYTKVMDMVGGFKAWVQSNLPVVQEVAA